MYTKAAYERLSNATRHRIEEKFVEIDGFFAIASITNFNIMRAEQLEHLEMSARRVIQLIEDAKSPVVSLDGK